ncbi:MAG: HDOD domain-containing protein [Victivallales bacterium]|nr:HDOD domain-containing protein [Victivallales bacterium]
MVLKKKVIKKVDISKTDSSISRQKPNIRLQMSDVENDDYWWNFKGYPPIDVPEFDAIDKNLIINDIQSRLASGSLPIIEIPENLLKAIRLLDSPDFDFHRVADLIERSPGLAGEFLKVVNSPLMSRGYPIHDLKNALPRLGKVKVKSLLYIYSAKMNLKGNSLFDELVADIVNHSYVVAIISSYLSQRFFADPDSAFMAGLLHDIGKLAILKSLSENFNLPKKLDFKVTNETFAYIFPELHEQVGVYIARHWNAGETVEAAVRHHHDVCVDGSMYDDPDMAEKLSYMTNIGDTCARILGKGRWIGPVRLFREAAVIQMDWEQSWTTIEYLNVIPGMVDFKIDM